MARTRAVGIVVKDSQVLTMKRRVNGKEYWVFPGGGVEVGETLEAAVIRELQEETSIAVSVDRLLYHVIYPDKESDHYFFLCDYISGEPKLGEGNELEEMRAGTSFYEPMWLPLDGLENRVLYPLEVRDWFLSDLADNFPSLTRDTVIRDIDIRH